MNIKRASLSTILALVTAATLVACGQESGENNTEGTMSSTDETVEQTMNSVPKPLDGIGSTVEDARSNVDSPVEE